MLMFLDAIIRRGGILTSMTTCEDVSQKRLMKNQQSGRIPAYCLEILPATLTKGPGRRWHYVWFGCACMRWHYVLFKWACSAGGCEVALFNWHRGNPLATNLQQTTIVN